MFLGHLTKPDLETKPALHQRDRASNSLLALLEVVDACEKRPSLREPTAQKLARALPGIMTWVYLVLSLRPDEWSEGSSYTIQDPTAHENIILALLRFTQMHETLHQAVTSNVSIIDFAVMSWVVTSGKLPLLYAAGNHRTCGAVDPIISLIRIISDKNPMGLANVVLSGRICSPELFFVRASQRMWMLVKPDTLPHVCHVEDIPVDANMCRITLIVEVLIYRLPDLAVPMLESMSPAYFMDALVRTADRSALIGCPIGRVRFLEHIFDSVIRVARWAELRSSFFIPTAKSVISSGAIRLVGSYITLPDDEHATTALESLKTLIQLVLNWVTFPSLIGSVSSATSQHLISRSAELKDESAMKGEVLKVLNALFYFHLWQTPAGRLHSCDNMAVSTLFARSYDAPIYLCVQHKTNSDEARSDEPQLGGTCSGCRSVAYCSASCQRQDWQFLHRHECREMRREYLGMSRFVFYRFTSENTRIYR